MVWLYVSVLKYFDISAEMLLFFEDVIEYVLHGDELNFIDIQLFGILEFMFVDICDGIFYCGLCWRS